MILLLGALGWGLLAIGAITHIWHHGRLRRLLAMHLDHERLPAIALTAAEAGLAILLPVLVLVDSRLIVPASVGAMLLGSGFVVWITRLLFTHSDLPCACSFSEAPTTVWSLARASFVLLVVLLPGADQSVDSAEMIASFAVGLALAAAIFVLPEAITWPPTSRAVLARVDAYQSEAR